MFLIINDKSKSKYGIYVISKYDMECVFERVSIDDLYVCH